MPAPSLTPRRRRRRAVRLIRRGWRRTKRLVARDEAVWLVTLSLVALLCCVAAYFFSSWWPLSALLIPLALAINTLSIRPLLILEGVITVSLGWSVAQTSVNRLRVAEIVVIALSAVIVVWVAHLRERLGVAPTRGESMLIDLRDRLRSQSRLPELPWAWRAETVIKSAGGASFAGDFIVAAKTNRGRDLEVAVVDVSGKGVGAGTRALQLSGAFGGLLGSLPRDRFLPAANDYLLRQEWSEGFATCIHVAIDLDSGAFEVRTAGHPPAVQFHAGSGRWRAHWTDGPVLGLIPNADYSPYRGKMSRGDALVVYTDGVVETRRRDIGYGIDKLLGEGERLVKLGFEGGARRLADTGKSNNDDRALLLLYRI